MQPDIAVINQLLLFFLMGGIRKSLKERQKWWMGQFFASFFMFCFIRVIVIKNGFGEDNEEISKELSLDLQRYYSFFLMFCLITMESFCGNTCQEILIMPTCPP
jgi:hypothetical protein